MMRDEFAKPFILQLFQSLFSIVVWLEVLRCINLLAKLKVSELVVVL